MFAGNRVSDLHRIGFDGCVFFFIKDRYSGDIRGIYIIDVAPKCFRRMRLHI